MTLDRRHSYEISQMGDNTYATILPRNLPPSGAGATISGPSPTGGSGLSNSRNDLADYATLRNNSRVPPAVVKHFILVFI